jgi:hypothetical protein
MTKTNLLISIILGGIYLGLHSAASNGYGYTGYGGYHRGPSFWYWGGPNVYTDQSSRDGSVNGTDRIGGGPGSGK